MTYPITKRGELWPVCNKVLYWYEDEEGTRTYYNEDGVLFTSKDKKRLNLLKLIVEQEEKRT